MDTNAQTSMDININSLRIKDWTPTGMELARILYEGGWAGVTLSDHKPNAAEQGNGRWSLRPVCKTVGIYPVSIHLTMKAGKSKRNYIDVCVSVEAGGRGIEKVKNQPADIKKLSREIFDLYGQNKLLEAIGNTLMDGRLRELEAHRESIRGDVDTKGKREHEFSEMGKEQNEWISRVQCGLMELTGNNTVVL